MKIKNLLFSAIGAFFIVWTLYVSAFGIFRTGKDDKTIMLAYSQCFFNLDNYNGVKERFEETQALCKNDKNCIWRTSERFYSAYNYPFITLTLNLTRSFFEDKNHCQSISQSIYMAYWLTSAFALVLFLSLALLFLGYIEKQIILYSLVPLVFLHPYFNHFLTKISAYGLPHIEDLTYPLGAFPRSQLALLFCLIIFLIKDLRWFGIIMIMLLNLAIHTGQGTLVNLTLLPIIFFRLYLARKSLFYYTVPFFLGLMTIVVLLFAKSNYQATGFSVSAISVISSVVKTWHFALLALWCVVGILLHKKVLKNESQYFMYVTVAILLACITSLRAYNTALQSLYEETTTLLIISNRYEGTIAIALYLCIIQIIYTYLSHSKVKKWLPLSAGLLITSIVGINFSKWYQFTSEIVQLTPNYIERFNNEMCSGDVTIPTNNLHNALKNNQVQPSDEVHLHLLIDRTCQGL